MKYKTKLCPMFDICEHKDEKLSCFISSLDAGCQWYDENIKRIYKLCSSEWWDWNKLQTEKVSNIKELNI